MSDTPGYVKNLKKESVVQSVINCLTDAMRNKQLKPGDRIPPEPDLAASMGVARSSVREAIKILTYLGVLESKRSEGTFVCSGFQESMIDPMIYGMILNQDSFDNLMELREMVEAGIMRLASAKYNEEDMEEERRLCYVAITRAKEELYMVRTLTHAVRYETVSTMINTGRGEELLEAHSDLFETLRSRRQDNVEEIVRATYFKAALYGQEKN